MCAQAVTDSLFERWEVAFLIISLCWLDTVTPLWVTKEEVAYKCAFSAVLWQMTKWQSDGQKFDTLYTFTTTRQDIKR